MVPNTARPIPPIKVNLVNIIRSEKKKGKKGRYEKKTGNCVKPTCLTPTGPCEMVQVSPEADPAIKKNNHVSGFEICITVFPYNAARWVASLTATPPIPIGKTIRILLHTWIEWT